MTARPFHGVGGTPEPLAPGVVVSALVEPNPLHASNGLAFAPDGRLWIAQFLGGTVSALDLATGSLEPVLGSEGPLTAPDDLAFADDGSCYVVDLPPGLVWRRTPDGTLSLVTDGIVAPDGIATWRGRLFVNELAPDGRLLEILPDGRWHELAAGLALGNAMAVGPDGRLVYPHLSGGEVWAVDPDGGEPERLLDGLDRPVAVRFDAGGRMLVLSNADGSVLVDGRDPVSTGVRGADNLAVGPDGTWYVTGAFTGGLVALAPGGSRRQVLPPGLCGPFGLASVGGRIVAADHHTLAELVDGAVCAHEVGAHGLRGLAAMHGELLVTTEAGELRCGTVGGRWHRVARGLDRPCGLVAAGGEVLVAESGVDRVVRVGRAGEIDPVASGFDRLVDLAAADGEVWVTDAGRGQVVRLSDGLVVAAGLARPEGLVAHRGALVVVEAAAGRLTRVDPRTRTSTPVVGNLPLATLPPHVPAHGSGTGSLAQRPAPYAALAVHDGGLVVGLTGTGGVLRVGC
ncbi:hypothetical protein [Actinomycetospora sp. NBRC 106378]|uniref:hypothetical protein n=1 Tax=Actinomycetospora sp. NBRC 106378 TaxID=3032208 RepID=UPI0024A1CEB0|nr:hypothetical protein [Actinomycetospora sp. NBRC 106378]GLZ53821.1 hypothetical protein Acsp07_34380 [Actinomycetospora sp. NBRC 106378]